MDQPRLFRGSEFPRLVLFLALAGGGWAWFFLRGAPSTPAPPPRPLKVSEVLPLPPAETGGWFARIEDKTPLGPGDYPAYAELLERARSTTPQKLRAQARRDVLFGQLVDRPARYRGLPIHLEGTARRVVIDDEVGPGFSASRRLHEAWTFTPESHRFPYLLVFETAPRDLAVGPDLYEHVSFDGYFLKLMSYDAADTRRFAPMLVGRLTKFADAEASPLLPGRGPGGRNQWILIALVGSSALVLFRVLAMFRRRRRPPWQPSPTFRPVDEVDPETLANWLNKEDRDEREDWQGDDEYESSR